MVHPIIIGLAALVPGLAHGLLSQRRAMVIVITTTFLAIVAVSFTVWALWALPVIVIVTAADAIRRYRRMRGTRIRWNWVNVIISVASSLVINLVVQKLVVEAFRIPASSGYPALQIGDHVYADKLSLLWRAPERGELVVFLQPCERRDYVKRVIAVAGDSVEIRCSVVYVNGSALPTEQVLAEDSYTDIIGPRDEEIRVEVSRYRETNGDHTYDMFHPIDRPRRDRMRAHEYVGDDREDFPDEELRTCANQAGVAPSVHAPEQLPGKLVSEGDQREQCKPFRRYVVPDGHVFVLGDNRGNSNDSRVWGAVPVGFVKGRISGIWLPLGRFGGVD